MSPIRVSWREGTRGSGGSNDRPVFSRRSTFAELQQHEHQCDDGQTEMTESGSGARQQIVGRGFRSGGKAGEGGEENHGARIRAPGPKTVIQFTTS